MFEDFAELFTRCQQQEERRFMGDWSFLKILEELSSPICALVECDIGTMTTPEANSSRRWRITATGREVLAADQNRLNLYDIDCWFGGVRLIGENLWCWNAKDQSVTKPSLV